MQMAKASISENDEALFVGRRRYNNYMSWKGNKERENSKGKHFSGREQWKSKNFNGGEYWKSKNASECESWQGNNFKPKENSENSQYEARKKIICNKCGRPGHIQKFCGTGFV